MVTTVKHHKIRRHFWHFTALFTCWRYPYHRVWTISI